MNPGEYSTFEILKEYQGEIKRNEGIPVGDSWNAYFGKILDMCANRTNGIIRNIEKDTATIVDDGLTTTAIWEVF